MEDLLAEAGLPHLAPLLSGCPLSDCQQQPRAALLRRLAQLGVSRLAERQRVANAVARSTRQGLVAAARSGDEPELRRLLATATSIFSDSAAPAFSFWLP